MYILVTDRLVCSRCGPPFGLVLLADRLENRRVIEGHLGCPNCRARYPISQGFGDLRADGGRGPGEWVLRGEPLAPDDPEEAVRLGALLGVHDGSGIVLLVGPVAGHAARLARMMPDVEMLAVHPDLRRSPEAEGVTRIEVGDRLPLATGSGRGTVLQGEAVGRLVPEALRTLSPGARLVLLGPVDEGLEDLARGRAKVLMRADKALVASAP